MPGGGGGQMAGMDNKITKVKKWDPPPPPAGKPGGAILPPLPPAPVGKRPVTCPVNIQQLAACGRILAPYANMKAAPSEKEVMSGGCQIL